MKKPKFLALTLAVAVMLMGAGYAIWTDSVKINNTVNTGNLEVKLENGTLTLPDNGEYVKGTAVVDLDVDSTSHIAKVTLENLYPGAKVRVSIPFKNVGSIPVKFDGAPTNTAPIGSDLANYITIDNWSYTDSDIAPAEGGNIDFDITVDEDAPNDTTENAQATFEVKANFVQWK